MTNTVFDKTDRGREEIATRVHHLPPRLRTLLLLVDGKRDTVELMAKVAGLGLDEKALVDLLEGGFIAVAGAAETTADVDGVSPPAAASPLPMHTPQPSSASPGVGSSSGWPAPSAPSAPSASSGPAPAPAVDELSMSDTVAADRTPAATHPADNPALPNGAAVQGILREGETQFQALYNFFNETIRSAIGLRGYGMQLKVERAVTIDDFRALRQPYLDAVLKAKGPELEHSLRNRLDQLLNLRD